MGERSIFQKIEQVDGMLADRLLPDDQLPAPTEDELAEMKSFLENYAPGDSDAA